MREPKPFSRHVLKVVIVGLGLAIATVVALYLLEVLDPPLLIKTIVSSVLSISFSLGFSSLLYEAYLARSVSEELIELVRLDERLKRAGISDITDLSKVDWGAFLDDTDSVECLLGQRGDWFAPFADQFIELAQQRSIKIRLVVVPDPATAPTISGLDPIASTLASRLEARWGALLSQQSIAGGSSIDLSASQPEPTYSLLQSRTRTLVILHSLTMNSVRVSPTVIAFDRTETFPGDWFTSQMAATIATAAPLYQRDSGQSNALGSTSARA